MTLRTTLRAVPAMFRVGVMEAIAYRAEMVVWLLSTTMPFVSLMLWSAVASEGAVVSSQGRAWTGSSFVAYFLAAFVVRQLVSSWAAWEINYEVRQGTLSLRLLRPVHPMVSFSVGHLAAIPLRMLVALPVTIALVILTWDTGLPRAPLALAMLAASVVGAWLIAFLSNVLIGALALFTEQSGKLLEVWMTCFFVFSGYLFPLELFPDWLRASVALMPFRYQMGFPVELLIGAHDEAETLALLGHQWLWVLGLLVGAWQLWRHAIRRFQAVGG
ncbi:MAG: ABC-2 family transporter protein [Myxococcaceae bacterium]|nr:ABC-2 family transporter protein [Myxococcaceae bacterium]